MNFRAIILCCHMLLALPLFARENTDVVVMRNGDHLTCEIKGLNAGTLYVSLPYAIQTLSVDWSQVARLESRQLFIVKTEDGSVYRGALNSNETPGGHPIEIEITEAPETKTTINSALIVDASET